MASAGARNQARGHLADNVAHFARLLRKAGVPIGPGHVLDALAAVEAVGIERRDDLYWTLHASLIKRREHSALFDQAFTLFWRDPRIRERLLKALLPTVELPEEGRVEGEQLARRLQDAIAPERKPTPKDEEQAREEVTLDATLTYSDEERLRRKDFDEMTAEEIDQAKRIMARLRLPIMEVPTRRLIGTVNGHDVDLRATMRAALRTGGDPITLSRRSRTVRHPPLVVLCDISGSMEQYSRMLLHFLHALTNDRDRVHVFLFGTRLTNVTRMLRQKDIDRALADVGREVQDWAGGTRIGDCLDDFNRHWSRRVLGQGAVVLLITDGLDRAAGEGVDRAMERLHKSCRRLIWLNPLLRFDGFAPKSQGIRAMLPHVDDFRPVHNLASLADLAAALSRPGDPADAPMLAAYRKMIAPGPHAGPLPSP